METVEPSSPIWRVFRNHAKNADGLTRVAMRSSARSQAVGPLWRGPFSSSPARLYVAISIVITSSSFRSMVSIRRASESISRRVTRGRDMGTTTIASSFERRQT